MNKLIAVVFFLSIVIVVGCENSPISLQDSKNESGKAQIFLSNNLNTASQANNIVSQVNNIVSQAPKSGGNHELQNIFTSYEVQFFESATSTPIRTLSFSSGDSLLFDTTGLSMVRFVRVIAQPTGEAVKINSIRFPGGDPVILTASQKLVSGGNRVAYAVNFSTRTATIAPGISTNPNTVTSAVTRYVQYQFTPLSNPSGNVLNITGTESGAGKNWKAFRVGSTSQFSLFVLENGQADSANGYLSAIRFTSPQLSSVQVENATLNQQQQDWRHGIFAISSGFEVRQPGSAQTLYGSAGIFYPVSITVVTENGAPVSGASVMLSNNGAGSYSGTTNLNGVLTLSVPQGTFQMSVQKNGYRSVNKTEEIVTGLNFINVTLLDSSSAPPPPPLSSGARIFLDSNNTSVTINGVQRQVRKLYIDSLLFNNVPIVSGARVDIENAELVAAFENLGWTENVSNLGFRRSVRAVTENGRRVIYFPVSGSGSYRYVLRSSDNTVTVEFVVQGNSTILVNNIAVALTRVRAVTNPNGSSMNYELVNLMP
jgi:hypothetical protein